MADATDRQSRRTARLLGRRAYFKRLFLVLTVASVLPLLIAGLFSYRASSRSVRQQIDEKAQQYAREVAFVTETIVDQIRRAGQLVFFYPEYVVLRGFPERARMLSLEAPYEQTDMAKLYRFLSAYGDLVQDLESMTRSFDLVDSAYLLDAEAGAVYATERGIVGEREFFDTAWVDFARVDAPESWLMPARSVLLPEGVPARYITVTTRENLFGNVFGMNIDANRLHEFVSLRIAGSDDSIAFVAVSASNSNELQIHGGMDPRVIELAASSFVIQGDDSRPVAIEYGGDDLLVSRWHAADLGWDFYSVLAMEPYYSALVGIQLRGLLIGLGAAIAIIGLGFVVATRLYQPVRMLLGSLPSELSSEDESSGRFDEFSVLREAVDEMVTEDRDLRTRLRDSLPVVKESFVRSLIAGSPLPIEEIADRLRRLDLGFGVENVLPIMIGHKGDAATKTLEEVHLFQTRLATAAHQQLFSRFSGALVQTDESHHCAIISAEAHTSPAVFERAGSLIRRLEDSFGQQISIGVGSHCESVRELPASARRAAEALEYALTYREHDVFSWEEVPATSDSAALHYQFRHRIDEMARFLKAGDSSSASTAVNALFDDLGDAPSFVQMPRLRQFFLRLAGDLLDLVDDLGLAATAGHDRQPLIERVLSPQSLDGYRQVFLDEIDHISSHIQADTSERTNRRVVQVLDLLEQDYGVTVNLNTIAARLNLNPSYVSRLFSSEVGVTFTHYLTELRIRKARGLLETTDTSVREIGEMVGYPNNAYFATLFREKTGLSPAEFRKRHRHRATPPRAG